VTATAPTGHDVAGEQARAGFWWNTAAIGTLVVGLALALADLDFFFPPVLAASVLFALTGHRAGGFAAGFRQGTALASLTLAKRIAERTSDAPTVDPDLPGLVALRRVNADVEGWSWCEEHGYPRYSGPNPCDRLHQIRPGAQTCGYHLRAHGPGEFGPLCTAWADVERAAFERSSPRRYLRWLSR
jgi:hypothetical protein